MEMLKNVFVEMCKCSNWSLQLLKISTFKSSGTKYACRQIQLEHEHEMVSFINEISEKYLSGDKGSLDCYTSIVDYDGTASGTTIYKLTKDNSLIASEYNAFLNEIANPSVEGDPFCYTSAYVLKGVLSLYHSEVPVKLVSMQSPITKLKHKFRIFSPEGTFSKIEDKVLTLRSTIDVVIIGNVIYFLTLAGENLFNMARAYKTVCHEAVMEIEKMGILSDMDSFKVIAESGHNPRKFISFDKERLYALKNTNKRKTMAKRFFIPLDGENRFDVSADGAADKIVKLLCNKGMVDPFREIAVEVSGSKLWQP